MNKWKITSLLLVVVGVTVMGFQIKEKFADKKEVSAYVTQVHKWNKEQAALQKRYQEEVFLEEENEKAIEALDLLIQDSEKLGRKVETVDSKNEGLQLAAQYYLEGLHHTIDGYRYFYHAMKLNEASLLEEGEEALKEAERAFRTHDKALNTLASRHFIQLYQ